MRPRRSAGCHPPAYASTRRPGCPPVSTSLNGREVRRFLKVLVGERQPAARDDLAARRNRASVKFGTDVVTSTIAGAQVGGELAGASDEARRPRVQPRGGLSRAPGPSSAPGDLTRLRPPRGAEGPVGKVLDPKNLGSRQHGCGWWYSSRHRPTPYDAVTTTLDDPPGTARQRRRGQPDTGAEQRRRPRPGPPRTRPRLRRMDATGGERSTGSSCRRRWPEHHPALSSTSQVTSPAVGGAATTLTPASETSVLTATLVTPPDPKAGHRTSRRPDFKRGWEILTEQCAATYDGRVPDFAVCASPCGPRSPGPRAPSRGRLRRRSRTSTWAGGGSTSGGIWASRRPGTPPPGMRLLPRRPGRAYGATRRGAASAASAPRSSIRRRRRPQGPAGTRTQAGARAPLGASRRGRRLEPGGSGCTRPSTRSVTGLTDAWCSAPLQVERVVPASGPPARPGVLVRRSSSRSPRPEHAEGQTGPLRAAAPAALRAQPSRRWRAASRPSSTSRPSAQDS